MGKLNVALLRYLSREDFRVLTAVSRYSECTVVHVGTIAVCVCVCVCVG